MTDTISTPIPLPRYTAPQIIPLDTLAVGLGANCSDGASHSGGTCTMGGVATASCVLGVDATSFCDIGSFAG